MGEAHATRAPRRRVPWKVVAVAGAALAVGAVVAATFVAPRLVGPIQAGGGLSSTRATASVEYRHVRALDADGRDAFAVDGTKSGVFAYAFEIENSGRVPITLDDVSEEFAGSQVERRVRISDVGLHRGPRAGEDVELSGIEMAPGERRRLTLTYSWKTTCDPGEPTPGGGGTLQHAGVELRYRAYGVLSRTQSLEPPGAVVFVCGSLPRPDGSWVTAGLGRLPGR